MSTKAGAHQKNRLEQSSRRSKDSKKNMKKKRAKDAKKLISKPIVYLTVSEYWRNQQFLNQVCEEEGANCVYGDEEHTGEVIIEEVDPIEEPFENDGQGQLDGGLSLPSDLTIQTECRLDIEPC